MWISLCFTRVCIIDNNIFKRIGFQNIKGFYRNPFLKYQNESLLSDISIIIGKPIKNFLHRSLHVNRYYIVPIIDTMRNIIIVII